MMNKNILKKTRKDLTILHTIVVGIIFLLFALFIYQYFYQLTYKKVDQSLYSQYQKIAKDIKLGTVNNRTNMNSRMVIKGNIIYISKDNRLISSYPEGISEYIRPFELSKDINKGISHYKYNESYFRQIKEDSNGYTIEIIKIVDVESALLSQLKFVLIISSIAALIVVYFTSRFLTNKSLKPIEESWENQQLFVQDASHELRTPLTIIFSKIEGIIKRPNGSVKDEMKNLVIVIKEVRRLRKLVNDLLKLAKEDAIVTINKSDFNVVSMINEISQEYEDICGIQSKQLSINYSKSNIDIYSDKEKLKQVIVILLDNAIKYTKEKDFIDVNINEDNNFIKIKVSDTGIGIKEEELSMIFNRFYRSSSHRETNTEGSGIGLSIAKVLISNLDGEIQVKSKYSEGSEFTLVIPKNKKQTKY